MTFHTLQPFHVRFSETDMAGVVHFSQILRWVENAESDFFCKNGIKFVDSNAGSGTLCGWPRVNVHVDFVSPARYDDCISVEIRPKGVPAEKSVKIEWEFSVFLLAANSEKRIIAKGTWTTIYAEIQKEKGIIKKAEALPEKLRIILGKY